MTYTSITNLSLQIQIHFPKKKKLSLEVEIDGWLSSSFAFLLIWKNNSNYFYNFKLCRLEVLVLEGFFILFKTNTSPGQHNHLLFQHSHLLWNSDLYFTTQTFKSSFSVLSRSTASTPLLSNNYQIISA